MKNFAEEIGATNLPWVDSPFFDELVAASGCDPATERIVRDFARDGYVVIDPEIPAEVIDEVTRDLRGRFTPTYVPYYADETRVQDAWRFSENVRQVAAAPRVIELLSLLYRRDPIPFQTLNFRVGSQQRTHSDTIHFDSVPQGFMCGVWVALEDIDSRNGPLHYYPTSQRLPIYNLHDIGITASSQSYAYELYPRYEDFVEALMRKEQLERLELNVQRGQALIWSANLFHGGSPILDSSRTRLTQVTHYYFGGCMYYTPLLSDPALGRMYVRRAVDIRTESVIPQYYNGQLIANPGEWPPRVAEPPLPMKERLVRWLTSPDASVQVR
jgi:ectoine hydroxylase-related dioxygenase (phytanoyl-CoA dioxygenase family)